MEEEKNVGILKLLKEIREEIKETKENSSEHTHDLKQINKSIIKISDIFKNIEGKKDTNTWKNRDLNEYDRIILKNLESRISILEENKETYKVN